MSKETREYAKQLVSQMTLEEKMSQMVYQSPAIERLGIPAYNWWNEALHGVARAGQANDSHELPLVNGQVDVLQGLVPVGIAFFYLFEFNHRIFLHSK